MDGHDMKRSVLIRVLKVGPCSKMLISMVRDRCDKYVEHFHSSYLIRLSPEHQLL